MNRLKNVVLVLLLLVLGGFGRPSAAENSFDYVNAIDTLSPTLDSAIVHFTSSKAMQSATVGICVMDIRTGNVVAEHNIDTPLIPASVMKLVTSACALKRMSENYRFRTRVRYTGKIDDEGVLHGNIIIEGSLDPTLNSRFFPDMEPFASAVVENVKLFGIKAIEGCIIARENTRPEDAVPDDWEDADIVEDYGSGVHALNYNDNMFSLIVDTSSGRPLVVDTIPHLRNIEIDNRMTIVNRGRVTPAISRHKNSNKLVIGGQMRRMDNPVEAVTTMPHPAEGVCADIREALMEEGIVVMERNISDGEDSVQIMSYTSPTLSEIVSSLLFRSDNMYAEALQRKLGEIMIGKPTCESGEKAVGKLVKQWDLPTEGVRLYDGSGLSRTNRLTPRFLATLLCRAANDWQTGYLFPSLLPHVGTEGTVKVLLRNTPLTDRLVLKSGSMNGVRSYAGYYPADSPKYAVVLMSNGFRCNYDQLMSAIQTMFLEMFEQYDSTIRQPEQ